VVLVVDALDGCEDDDIGLIVQLLTQLRILRSVCFRVFITSRPETPIRYGFNDISTANYRDFVLHNMFKSIVSCDISVFLRHELARIRKRCHLPIEWPDEKCISELTQRSDGLFIYATTICRFIGDKDSYLDDCLSFVLQRDYGRRIADKTAQLDVHHTLTVRNS
jgi:hypothetical protein